MRVPSAAGVVLAPALAPDLALDSGDPCRPGAPHQGKMRLLRMSGMVSRTVNLGHWGCREVVRHHPTGWALHGVAHFRAVHSGDFLPCGVSYVEQ